MSRKPLHPNINLLTRQNRTPTSMRNVPLTPPSENVLVHAYRVKVGKADSDEYRSVGDLQKCPALVRAHLVGPLAQEPSWMIRHHRPHGAEHRLAAPLHQMNLDQTHLARHRDHAP